MTIRTGQISQQTRGTRDKEKNIHDLRKEIIKKRNETKDLITLLNSLIPTEKVDETYYPTNKDYTKRMAKDKRKEPEITVKDSFVRPTRMRVRVTARSGGESITQQHMKEDCDINVIIKRHAETGNISHLNPSSPLYLDCTQVRDLQSAISLVEEAEDNFLTLPSAVRKACDNDPVQFVEMLYTEEGTLELGEAGLEYAAEPKKPETDEVKPTPKPKTIPAQQIVPGTEAQGETPTPETTPPPQGGK